MKLNRKPFAFINNLNIRAKILIGYFATLALAILVGGLAIYQLGQVNATVTRLTGQLSNVRDLAEAMGVQIYRIRLYANQYINQEQDPAILDKYNLALDDARSLLDQGDQTIMDPNRIRMQAEVHNNFDQFAASFAEVVRTLSARQELETTVLDPQYSGSMIKLVLLRSHTYESMDYVSADFTSKSSDAFSMMQMNVNQYLATDDEKYADQAEMNYKTLQSNIDLLNASVRSQADRTLVAEIGASAAAYQAGFLQVRSLAAQQRDEITNRLDVYGPAVEQNATEIVDSVNAEFAAQSQKTNQMVQRTRLGTIVTIGLVMVAVLIFATLLSRGITQPIQRLARAAQGVAAGALDQAVPVQSNDELGILAEAFNHMTGQVRGTMAELQQSLVSLQASQERQQMILDTSPFAILISRFDGTILYANQVLNDQFGTNVKQSHITTEDFYVNLEDRKVVQDTIDQQGYLNNYELHVRRANGELAWVLLSIRVFNSDGESVLLSTLIDITERKEIEDRLRQAQAMAKLGSWRLDIANNRLHCSDEMFHIFGIDKDHITDPSPEAFSRAIHPEDMAEVERVNHAILQGKKPIPLEYRVVWPDQSIHVVRSEASELTLDEAGQPASLAGIVQDITERKQAEKALREAQQLYENIFRLSPELIVVTSAKDGRYLAVSDSHERITGYRPDEVIGHRVEEFLIWESPDDQIKMLQMLEEQGAVHNVEVRFHRRSGELYTTLFSMARMEVGEESFLVCVVTDISDRKQVEEEVRRLNTELELRVAERTGQLEMANKELESFSYSVSHDLRAPLRAIDGFSRILEEEFPDLPAGAERLIQSVRSNTQHMGKLIDDLLRFSRLNRQSLNKQRVDMTELVRQAMQTLEPERAGRQVEIIYGKLPACQGDPGLLLQVWTNLLSNALKFTRRREVAQIEIGCQANEHGESVYFVRDNGVGFDMQYASKLFGVFQRLHRADEFEGTGVGLALVQRIIQRHGGRIWVEAQHEKGATFSFTVGS